MQLAAIQLGHFSVEPCFLSGILLDRLDELAADAAAVDGQMAFLTREQMSLPTLFRLIVLPFGRSMLQLNFWATL